MIYSSDGVTVEMNKLSTLVSIMGSSATYSWSIYEITPSGLIQEHLLNQGFKRINDSSQNSVVRLLSNSQVQVAEIYSFHTNMVDASIAFKNLQNVNATFLVSFQMNTGVSAYKGYGQSAFNIPLIHKKGVYLIPQADNAVSLGNMVVNWQGERSISLLNGTISSSSTSSLLDVPFGPINLMSNETYSIDPRIAPLIIPVGGGGGGGSGGGGTTYTSPSSTASISNVNMTSSSNDYFLTGETVDLHADVTSFGGASSVTLKFDINYGGSYYAVHSETIYSTGSYTFSWIPPSFATGYYGYRDYVENPTYTTSSTNTVNLGIFPPAPSSTSKDVYTSSGGQLVGSISLSSDYARTINGNLYSWAGGSDTLARFGTAVEWSTSSSIAGVWSIDQTISNYKAIGSYTGVDALVFSDAYVTTQDSSYNSLMIYVADYLVNIANQFVFNLIPSPSYFYQATSSTSTTSQDTYTYTYSGTGGALSGYHPLQASNGSSSHLFGVVVPSSTFVNSLSGQYMSLVQYSVTVSFVSGLYQNDLYATSGSLITGIYVNPSG